MLGAEGGSSHGSENLFKSAVGEQGSRELLLGAARGLFEAYRQERAIGGVWEARRLVSGEGGSRTITLSPVQESIPEDVLGLKPTWVDWEIAGFDALEFSTWRWGLSAAERIIRLMSRHLRDLLPLRSDDLLLETSDSISKCLNRIEAVRDEAEARLRALDPMKYDSDAVMAINLMMRDLNVSEVAGEQVRISAERFKDAVGGQLTREQVILCAFSIEVVGRAFHAREPFQRTAPFDFLRLGPDIDAPVLAGGPFSATDQASGDQKLYGIRAMHFAAFGKPEWRRWDWTWGRLDAITHLGRALGRDDDWITTTQRLVLEAEGWTLNQFAGQLEHVVNLTDTDVIREFGSEVAGRQSLEQLLDRALDLLSGTQEPALVGRLGRWLSVGLRTEQPERLSVLERVLRRISAKLARTNLEMGFQWISCDLSLGQSVRGIPDLASMTEMETKRTSRCIPDVLTVVHDYRPCLAGGLESLRLVYVVVFLLGTAETLFDSAHSPSCPRSWTRHPSSAPTGLCRRA